MAKPLDPPSYEYLLALRGELKVQFQGDDAQIARSRTVREQTNLVPLPDAFKLVEISVRDPTTTDEIQRVGSMLSVNAATLKCTPPKPSDAGTINATLREKWTEGLLDEAGRRLPGSNAFASIIDGQVGDGGGWSKFLFSKDLWDVRYRLSPSEFTDDPMSEDGNPGKSAKAKYIDATESAKMVAGSPFIWIPLDAATIYPVWQGARIGGGLEVTKRPRSSTFRQYRLGTDKQGNIVPDELGQGVGSYTVSAGSAVDFLEFWDDVWACYAVVGSNLDGKETGQVVQRWKHGYQRCPYFYAPGLLMNHWRNRKVGWGVSESKRYLVELRSFLWTLAAQAVARDTMTSFTRTAGDAAEAFIGNEGAPKKGQEGPESYAPGLIYPLKPGQVIAPFQHPPVVESLKLMLTLVSEAIEKLESPRMTGNMSGLEGAGFAINQVLSADRVRFAPLAQNTESMLREVTEFAWFLTRRKVKEAVWIWGGTKDGYLKAAPEDLIDTVKVDWSLNPEQPSDKLILNRYLNERLTAKTISVDQVIELLGDNPDEVRLGLAMDAIRAGPEYQKLLQGMVLQKVGRGDLLGQAAEAMQTAQTGMIGPAGAPGGAGMPQDQTALAMSPNGAGAAPVAGPPNGSVPGAPSGGVVVPNASAAPGAQQIVGASP